MIIQFQKQIVLILVDLFQKLNAIQINQIQKKISDADKTNRLVKKTDYNIKITEIKSKIPTITGLATSAVLTLLENKIPDISSLVKKTGYDAENNSY